MVSISAHQYWPVEAVEVHQRGRHVRRQRQQLPGLHTQPGRVQVVAQGSAAQPLQHQAPGLVAAGAGRKKLDNVGVAKVEEDLLLRFVGGVALKKL